MLLMYTISYSAAEVCFERKVFNDNCEKNTQNYFPPPLFSSGDYSTLAYAHSRAGYKQEVRGLGAWAVEIIRPL